LDFDGAMSDDREKVEWQKDFEALDCMSRARVEFAERLCEASATDNEEMLDRLRDDKMFELAHFFFALKAMNLDGPEDVAILAELHNEKIVALTKNERAMKLRGLTVERLLQAMFTGDTQPRLEMIWRQQPGALDQSNLARFLHEHMSSETVRKLVEACCLAGFVERRRHATGTVVVLSNGFLEKTMSEAVRNMRLAITTC
jgi:hypothetical protein